MARLLALLVLAASASAAPAAASAAGFEGRRCTPPSGHRIADCRVGRHGTPDLSRAAWHALRGAEVTIGVKIESVAPNLAAGGARAWPLIDAQPMGTLETAPGGRLVLRGLDGTPYRVTSLRTRGHGCAASLDQQRRFTLLQIIARAPSGGTQAFADTAAFDRQTASGRAALAAFAGQRGGGTGCGPSGREVGRVRDPVAKVDSFATCDPNSDGTLTWRYWSIRTGVPGRPRLYGWIPARCPARMRG
jgi:hypothetical protein